MEKDQNLTDSEQNHMLVNFFLENFYESEGSALKNLVSANFTFSVDNGPDMDFGKYVERKDFMHKHIEINFDKAKTEDDKTFTSNIKVIVPRVDQPVLFCNGEMTLHVSHNLIDRISVIYDSVDGGDTSIQDAIADIKKIKSAINFI